MSRKKQDRKKKIANLSSPFSCLKLAHVLLHVTLEKKTGSAPHRTTSVGFLRVVLSKPALLVSNRSLGSSGHKLDLEDLTAHFLDSLLLGVPRAERHHLGGVDVLELTEGEAP